MWIRKVWWDHEIIQTVNKQSHKESLGEASMEIAKTLNNIGSVIALKWENVDSLVNWKNALSIYK